MQITHLDIVPILMVATGEDIQVQYNAILVFLFCLLINVFAGYSSEFIKVDGKPILPPLVTSLIKLFFLCRNTSYFNFKLIF